MKEESWTVLRDLAGYEYSIESMIVEEWASHKVEEKLSFQMLQDTKRRGSMSSKTAYYVVHASDVKSLICQLGSVGPVA